jgi:exonuclease SbcC
VIPRKLQLRNFMCYREDVPPLEFDGVNIACLSGENGAGKSALLDALTWALWGEARLRSDDDLIALGAQEMEVDLVFALDGQDYRVIRKRNKAKRGQSWLDFQMRNNGTWKAMSAATLPETQRLIETTLRMGYDTFANSAFLRQGHADEFTRRKPAERKKVLAEILGLDIYEGLEAKAKERVKTLDVQIKVLEGQIVELEREAAKRDYFAELVAQSEERVAQIEEQIRLAEANWAEANDRVQSLETLKAQLEVYTRQLEDLRTDRAKLALIVEERGRKLAAAREFLTRRDEILANIAKLREAQAEVGRMEGLRSTFDTLSERRNTCVSALDQARYQVEGDLRNVEGQLSGLRDRARERPKLETKLAQLKAQLGDDINLSGELEATRARRQDTQERLHSANQLQLERGKLQGQIDMRRNSLIGTREELKRNLKKHAEDLKDVDRWRVELGQAGTERMHLEHEERRLDAMRQTERESVEQAGALRAACSAAEAHGKEINKKLAMLSEDLHACPLCGHELGENGIAHIETEYEAQRQKLRAEYSASKREAEQMEARLTQVRSEIKALERLLATLPNVAARIARLESELQNAEETRRQQAEDQRTLSDVELQLVKGDYEQGIRAELARVEASLSGLGDPETLNRDLKRQDARITQLEKQIDDQRETRRQIDQFTDQIARIERETPALHECEEQRKQIEAKLRNDDYGHAERAALATVDAEIAVIGYSHELLAAARAEVKTLTPWIDEERSLERAEERIANDDPVQVRDLESLATSDQKISALTEQTQERQRQITGLVAAIRQRDEAAGAVKAYRSELEAIQNDRSERRVSLARAEQSAANAITCREQRQALAARKSLFEELTVAFGKKGVQALLIETAIPEIEREANALLSRMTDNQMHLTFETQRDTKKGDVSETLEIKIADGLGTRDYDAYSGGESFRVDFAIRIALSKLLARRAGARLETLVIDEGFGSQDARGRERLVEAITSVQSDFKQILVVTHIQELKDMFPIQIEITKTEQGSVWAIG